MKNGNRKMYFIALMMWGVLLLSNVIVHFHRISPAVILDYLIVDFSLEHAALAGALAGMYAIVYMLMQIPSGLLADFWGPRKTVASGMIVACLGSIVFALAPHLLFAFIGRGLIGFGVSVTMVSILKFQSSWFKVSFFATMTGLTTLSGNIGKIIGTTPLASLSASLGWRTTFIIVGIVTFIIAVMCFFIVHDTPEEFYKHKVKTNKKQNRSFNVKDFVELFLAFKNILKNPCTVSLFIIFFGLAGPLLAFSGAWSIPYLMQVHDYSRNESANILLLMTIGIGIGSPLVGYISDKFKKRSGFLLQLLLILAVLWSLLLFWNKGKPPELALYPIFFLMGFSLSAAAPLFSLVREVNDPSYVGTALGVINIAPFAGMAIMQPLLGFILDSKWGGLKTSMGVRIYPVEAYRLLFAACLVVVLISCYFALKVKGKRQN